MLEMNFKQTLGSLRLEVNTELPTESITAVFGLSGAGKTSLINVIGGLTKPDSGRIILNNHTLVDTERKFICHLKNVKWVMYSKMPDCFLITL